MTRGSAEHGDAAGREPLGPARGGGRAPGRDPPRADRDVRPLAVPAAEGARRRGTARSRSSASCGGLDDDRGAVRALPARRRADPADRADRPPPRPPAVRRTVLDQLGDLDVQGDVAPPRGGGRRHRVGRVRRRPRPVLRAGDDDVGPAHRHGVPPAARRAGPDVRRAGRAASRTSAATGWRRRPSRTPSSTSPRRRRGSRSTSSSAGRGSGFPPGSASASRRRRPTSSKEVAAAVEKGYHRVKMKVKKGKDVDYVRGRAGPLPRRAADGRRERRLPPRGRRAPRAPRRLRPHDDRAAALVQRLLRALAPAEASSRRRSASTSRSTTSPTRRRRSPSAAAGSSTSSRGASAGSSSRSGSSATRPRAACPSGRAGWTRPGSAAP